MINHTRPLVLVAATALAITTLTACGGGSNSGNSAQKAAEAQLSSIQSAVAQASSAVANMTADPSDGTDSSDGSSSSSAPSVPDGDAASFDACSLLSAADAQSVAMADKLDAAETASTVYTFKATKEEPGAADRSACRFDIYDPNGEGTMLVEVGPGSMINLFNVGGTKVPGLGDEAYTGVGGGAVVRVGGLMINEGDDSFGMATTVDLLRKMAPNLK